MTFFEIGDKTFRLHDSALETGGFLDDLPLHLSLDYVGLGEVRHAALVHLLTRLELQISKLVMKLGPPYRT